MTLSIFSRLFSCAGPPPTSGENNGSNFSSTLMDENISFAESVISKCDPNSSSLFSDRRHESSAFLRAVSELRRALLFFSSPDFPHTSCSRRDKSLVRAQTLMQTAMRVLEKEFHRILLASRHLLDSVSLSSSSSSSSSSDDEILLSPSKAIADLRSIAEAMMANGYGMECVRIYKLLRKSILEEALFLLGFDLRLPNSDFHKTDWPILDLRIKSWLAAARISFTSHFAAELLLCNQIFDASDSADLDLIQCCFADVANSSALAFLSFPESVARTKPSPEKLFRILELHQTISNLLPHIESTFSYESTAAVKLKAAESLQTLAEAARDSLAGFEHVIHKESSKIPVPGGGIHPLTHDSMNYLSSLSNHLPALIRIYAGIPFRPPEPLPEMSAPCASTIVPASVSGRIAWLLLVVLCKLDHKSEFYKEVSHSYLFLANNVQYVVNKVNASGLRMVLGARWVERHENTATRYMERYGRFSWGNEEGMILPA